MRSRCLAWMLVSGGSLVIAAGCGSKETTTVSEAGPDAPWVPAGCEGVDNIFRSESCLSGLRSFCRVQTSEADCASQTTFPQYAVVCTWARVITFSGPASCTIASD